jgi:hypothetical protein
MRWAELRGVKLATKPAHFRMSSSQQGLVLKVAGADIVLQDIYDRPLEVIDRKIREYWR